MVQLGVWPLVQGLLDPSKVTPDSRVSAHLGPGVLLAQQVGVEVSHLPLALVGEAPHQFPVAHVVKLLPVLLGLTALLETPDSLWAAAGQLGPNTPSAPFNSTAGMASPRVPC